MVGGGGPSGPWEIPLSAYNTALDSPNVTTQYSLQAPDITARFPARGRFANWTLTVSVTADIPTSIVNTTSISAWFPNQSFTGSRVQLTLPTTGGGDDDDDNEFEPDRSWEVCVINWDVGPDRD